MDDDLTFGAWLRRRRQALHLTQQQLGRLAGCSGAMIKKLEADLRRPSPDVARLLAAALQIPPQDQPAFIRFTRGERAEVPPLPALAMAVHHRPLLPSTNVPVPPTPLIG